MQRKRHSEWTQGEARARGAPPADLRRRASHAHCPCGHPAPEICSSHAAASPLAPPRRGPRADRRLVIEASIVARAARMGGRRGMVERGLHVARACPRAGDADARAGDADAAGSGVFAFVGRAQNFRQLSGSWFPTNGRGRVGESPVVHRTGSQLNAFAALPLIVEFEPQFSLTFVGFLILL